MSGVALWLGVGVAGGLGAIVRFLVHEVVSVSAGPHFPLGTLAVNLSGSLVLGLLVGLGVHGDAYLLAGTAVIGSYTTFSTWMFDSRHLHEQGRARAAALNVGLSLALGVGAVALGRLLGGG
jgi:fluoride exporter